jgi:hypothetical protein
MPFCINCGNEIQEDQKFCPACGTQATSEGMPATPPPYTPGFVPPPPQAPAAVSPRPAGGSGLSTKLNTLAIVGAILLLIGAIVFLFVSMVLGIALFVVGIVLIIVGVITTASSRGAA